MRSFFINTVRSVGGVTPPVEHDTLEDFGGEAFYKMYWGELQYTPESPTTTKVTYLGVEDVFDSSYVNKWLEPSRIHKGSSTYPASGRNYFPGLQSSVYSKVLSVIDGKNLIVDFPYNGGNVSSPTSITNQDGIFFFNNKPAIEAWASSPSRKETLFAEEGSIYGSLGVPFISVAEGADYDLTTSNLNNRPILHIMMSDNFDIDVNATGGTSQSFIDTFGATSSLFNLPAQGSNNINVDWQLVGPTYTAVVVQYGVRSGSVFNDPSNFSSNYGLKRIANFNQFAIRDKMFDKLGFVREGASFRLLDQGYCNSGGIEDNSEITQFQRFRFEGDWYAKNPNNMKGRGKGGLKIEWIGKSPSERGNFIEMDSVKTNVFNDISIRWNSNRRIEVNDPEFTFYNLSSQEWTGGGSTDGELTYLKIDGQIIGTGNNGDWWLTNGVETTTGVDFSATQVNIFDRIPAVGNVISQDLTNHVNNGIVGKKSNTEWEIWGWAVKAGDVFTYSGVDYTISSAVRGKKTWIDYGAEFSPPIFAGVNRKINITTITLDAPISDVIGSVSFTVKTSTLGYLLDGSYRDVKAYWTEEAFDPPGHLMYADFNTNLDFENINVSGYFRASDTVINTTLRSSVSGTITSVPIASFSSTIWKAGKKIWIMSPDFLNKEEVTISSDVSSGATSVSIISKTLLNTYPVGSIVVAKWSLMSQLSFKNVFSVNEDLSPASTQGGQYNGIPLRIRQRLTDNDTFRVKISGGRTSWLRFNDFDGEVELTNKPILIQATRLLNPIISDGLGIETDNPSSDTQIWVNNGKSVNLSNTHLKASLLIFGNGTFILDDVTSELASASPNNYYGLFVRNLFNWIPTPSGSEKLILQGDGGTSKLVYYVTIPPENLEVNLTNWDYGS